MAIMAPVFQIVLAALGALGFAFLYEIRGRKLIPGGGLYTAVYDFVSRNYETLGKNATHVLTEAFAIAIGILLASYVAKTVIRLKNRIDP